MHAEKEAPLSRSAVDGLRLSRTRVAGVYGKCGERRLSIEYAFIIITLSGSTLSVRYSKLRGAAPQRAIDFDLSAPHVPMPGPGQLQDSRHRRGYHAMHGCNVRSKYCLSRQIQGISLVGCVLVWRCPTGKDLKDKEDMSDTVGDSAWKTDKLSLHSL